MIPLSKTKAKYIKSLQLKKNRDKENRFLVEGKKSVVEFISSDFQMTQIIATEEFYRENDLPKNNAEVLIAKPDELSFIGTLKSNNAAIAIFVKPDISILPTDLDGVILALDGINDPGNLGTIIRTADWFGINTIMLNTDSVDPFNPKVISASKGSMSRVRLITQPLEDFLKEFSGEVIAADMTGISINQLEPIRKGVLIMGNESHGISPHIDPYITQRVTIPAMGKAESLNVGVATGIMCYMLSRSI